MGRGANWSHHEEQLLAKAFLYISEDAAVSTNQTMETLYSRVVEECKKRDPLFGRTAKACKNKWGGISKAV